MPKLLLSTAAGPADPTRASIPFHIAANGAVAGGTESAIVLMGDATELLSAGVAATVSGHGIPPLAQLLEKCLAGHVVIHV